MHWSLITSQKLGQMSLEALGFGLTAFLTEAVVAAALPLGVTLVLAVGFAIVFSIAMEDLEEFYFTCLPEKRRGILNAWGSSSMFGGVA